MSVSNETDPVPAATSIFRGLLGRLRAVDHFAVGRRVLATVALGRLSTHPVRQILFGHAHSAGAGPDSSEQVRAFLAGAAEQVEHAIPRLRSVFSGVLVPDIFQTRLLDQSTLFAAQILGAFPPSLPPAVFGAWFSDRLDDIVAAGPAATEVGTPRPLAEFMVELANIRPRDRVYDPCCGLGSLLAHATLKKPDLRILGADVHPVSWAFTTLRLTLLEADFRVERADTLRDGEFGQAERVLCDPPLGTYLGGTDRAPERSRNPPGGARRFESLFLERSFDALSSEGRAVVVVSQSVLFRRGADRELRARILRARALEGVIGLPAGAVPWTNAELALVIMDLQSSTDHVVFVDGALAKSAGGARTAVPYDSMLDAYRGRDEPWRTAISMGALLEDDNLVPSRRLRPPEERPDFTAILRRSEELMASANSRTGRINELLARLGLDGDA